LIQRWWWDSQWDETYKQTNKQTNKQTSTSIQHITWLALILLILPASLETLTTLAPGRSSGKRASHTSFSDQKLVANVIWSEISDMKGNKS